MKPTPLGFGVAGESSRYAATLATGESCLLVGSLEFPSKLQRRNKSVVCSYCMCDALQEQSSDFPAGSTGFMRHPQDVHARVINKLR